MATTTTFNVNWKENPLAKKSNNQIGRNITYAIEENKLTLVIDLGKTLGDSRSGKTILIASSGGNVEIQKDVKIGVNCYRTK